LPLSPLPITLAAGPYDRTRALADGRVTVAGADLRYITLDPEEIFFRMVSHGEFDVSEMSMATYLVLRDQAEQAGGPAPFAAIPVFPSRMFRHTSVYVNTRRIPPGDAGAARALVGATVGVAEWQLTANVWIRGILAEHYGVPVESARYRTGGLDAPGRHEKVALSLPDSIDIAPAPAGQTLSGLLASGEIDAVYSPRAPRSSGSGSVRRLFSDSRAEELGYFARTGIFPIMHVVVLRRDVYEQRPWLAQSLYKAFEQARAVAAAGVAETAAGRYMLPWAYAEAERTLGVMGEGFWSYGTEGNDGTLRTFLRYAFEQGLIKSQPEPEELFAAETREAYVI
jgi:4,5-dihydroxyphthalate decarboxylase